MRVPIGDNIRVPDVDNGNNDTSEEVCFAVSHVHCRGEVYAWA